MDVTPAWLITLSCTINPMTSYFQQHGTYLAQKTRSLMEKDDLVFMRQWLDDAPLQTEPVDMHSWGTVLKHVLKYYESDLNVSEKLGDHLRLGVYFEAMAALPNEQWWTKGPSVQRSHSVSGISVQTTTHPVYDAFGSLCSMLEQPGLTRTQSHLYMLIKSGTWEPDALLETLNRMQALQKRYVGQTNDCQGLEATAQGTLLRALRPLVLDTDWRPKDTDMYGNVWQVHDTTNRESRWDDAKRSQHFVQTWLRSTPSQTHQAMAFLSSALYQSSYSPSDNTGDFFPLDLTSCKPIEALRAAVDIFHEPKGAQLLAEHHPALVELIQMHLALSETPHSDTPMLEALVPSFKIKFQGGDPTMTVDSKIFEPEQ